MSDVKTSSMQTKCVHAGIGNYEFGPVVPPIYQTSTFKFESAQHGGDLFSGNGEGYIYTRMANPTIEAMEKAVAELEGGFNALGCGSGMAAIHTVFAGLLQQGDHLVCSYAVYGPTNTLLSTVMNRFGIETTFVNTENTEEIKAAMKDTTKMIYIETPGNPTLAVTDLKAVAEIAKEKGAKLVVDNTFMSPVLQNPLALGADIVVHSMTKFLNGHADVVAGIIVTKTEEDWKHLRKVLNQLGGVIDPFNAFLVHRGLKTLALRMKAHCKNAQPIAEFLENHPKVEWVRFPGLPSHPQHEICKKQASGFGGMITFELKGGFKAGETLMNSVQLAQLAVSLGGVESLIQHPASMTHKSMGEAARAKAGISEGLVRLSVGIEDYKEIIKDLENALEQI